MKLDYAVGAVGAADAFKLVMHFVQLNQFTYFEHLNYIDHFR